jgi:L-ascorbate 6-phosphate lactonase
MTHGKALVREVDETRVPYGMLAVWFLGQCSVIIKGGDTVLYIDPYLDPSPHRAFEPSIQPEDIMNADYFLVTHDHLDHMDPYTITRLAVAQGDQRSAQNHAEYFTYCGF